MKKIQVDILKLNHTAQVIGKQASTYKKLYEQIYMLNKNASHIWVGKDQQLFMRQMDGFKPELQKLYTTLENYENLLEDASKIYSNAQKQIIQRANSLL